jgi:hypothetical protein
MRKLTMVLCSAVVLLSAIPVALAQNGGPAKEINCPASPAEPLVVGNGTPFFSRNQNLCLPQLAPVGGAMGPLGFYVQGVEPGIRVDSQGTIYVDSIRGVPGGGDLWRWDRALGPHPDGGPNPDGTLPFKYEGQPDNCGAPMLGLVNGCANNVGSNTNPGIAAGGGDDDIAVNGPDPTNFNTPNLAFVSLYLADVSATNSTTRGDTFFTPPNLLGATVAADDRMWIDAFDDASTVYMNYHDLASGNIHVQLSTNGGRSYLGGFGEAIDAATLPAANGAGSGNVAGQIRIDKNTNSCSTRGTLYQIFSAPDSVNDNKTLVCAGMPPVACAPLRTVYVGVSPNAISGGVPNPAPVFKDYRIFTSLSGSPGATNGTGQVFPALATDDNGFAYAVWSDNNDIYLSSTTGSTQSSSATRGSMWNPPVRVNQGATHGGKSNVFPWVAADANGHVVVVWLGETNIGTPTTPANSNDRSALEPTCAGADAGTNNCWAQWNVYAAETVNGNIPNPTFTQYIVSDHIIHSGTVSTGGLGGGANRNLADFFQVALDPHHRANITFADDHVHSPACTTQSAGPPVHCADNDPATFRVGVPYFTRQLSTNPNIFFPSKDPTSCFKTVAQACSGGGGGGDAEGSGDEQGSDGHRAQFTFKVQGSCQPGGEMDFDEPDTGEHMKSTRMDALTVSGNQAIISGAGILADGTAVNYTAVVVGNAPVTAANSFAISWVAANGSAFQTAGPLTDGSIVVRTL